MSRFPLSRAFAGLTGRNRPEPGALADSPAPNRPAGPLVWVHTADGADGDAEDTLRELAIDLGEQHPVTLLVTGSGPGGTLELDEATLLYRPTPGTSRAEMRGFLAHWRPDAALWLGPPRPGALLSAQSAACPTTLIAQSEATLAGAERSSRAALRLVTELWASDVATVRAARAAGVGVSRIRLSGPLFAPPSPPPCIESDREELAERLAARPIWLAARPLAGELPHVLAAHRAALAIAHRAVLLLMPGADCPDDSALAERLAAEGFATASRAQGQEPADTTEIYITDRDAPEEDGLWFRLAPVCFLGGTFTPGGPVQSAAPAAALGSAICFGPSGGAESANMARLTGAGAARALASGATLPGAVSELLAPDRAAELAAAAWSEMSEGAEVIARLATHLATQLDAQGAH
ncbi:hypothetical protein FHY55_02120 [Oceanicola sp. D3]|uniref:hypothetical protein n=1 Tax=Oceanicola sp. D3 TaxID=2587163 RepID=UPI001122FE73|nr:hypothetical protein [Oceanicola sp. D3]QDC08108.1 hypothetical protein FHY55_02120 [Oceanicola sp. D3]